MNTFLNKSVASVLVASMMMVQLPARAAVIDTEATVTATASAATTSQRQQVMDFVARQDVQTQLQSFGVSPQQAAERIAALSDDEIQQLHGKMPQTAAGGSILGVLVFLFVLLLVTDILGLTKVFPFTRSVR